MTAVLNGNGVTSGTVAVESAPPQIGQWCRAQPAGGANPVFGYFLGCSVVVGSGSAPGGLDLVVAAHPAGTAYEPVVVRVAGYTDVVPYAPLPRMAPASLELEARDMGRSLALALLAGSNTAREAGKREGEVQERERHTEWLERFNDALNEAADENSLCSAYERFCEEWGLRSRERDFTVRVDLGSVSLVVRASSEEGAEEQITEEFVLDYARRNGVTFEIGEVSD